MVAIDDESAGRSGKGVLKALCGGGTKASSNLSGGKDSEEIDAFRRRDTVFDQ